MKELLYTPNIDFDMRDWKYARIKEVFAGQGCIMAITEDGRTLQKIKDSSFASRTAYWTRITRISLSNWLCGHAIGLVSDGTCIVAKRPLSFLTDRRNFMDALDFDEVNGKVKSWSNIVQAEVSDAYFALDADGRVHYAAVSRYGERDYSSINGWRNVRKIVPAAQNGLLGITRDGRILCAGANLEHEYKFGRLSELNGVVDACITGSEAEKVYVLFEDGTLVDAIRHSDSPAFRGVLMSKNEKVLDSLFDYTVYCLDSKRNLLVSKYGSPFEPVRYYKEGSSERSEPVSSFAVMIDNHSVIAVSSD